jgi:CheY-like chemotaxis protein/signal transduction histidine kinase
MFIFSTLIVDLLHFVEKKSQSSIFNNHNISAIIARPEVEVSWEEAAALFNQADGLFKEKEDIDEFVNFLLSNESIFGQKTTRITSKIFNYKRLYDVAINFIGRRQFPKVEFTTDFGGDEFLLKVKSSENPKAPALIFILLKRYLEFLPTITGAAPAKVDLSFNGNQFAFTIKPLAERNLFKVAVRFAKDHVFKSKLIGELLHPDTNIDLALTNSTLSQTLGQGDDEIRILKDRLNRTIAELEEIELISGSGTWTIDVTSKMVRLSTNAARIFGLGGYPIETSLTTLISCFHPEDQSEFVIAYSRLKADTPDLFLELRVLTKDSNRILQQKGKLKGTTVIGSISDVTTLRRNASHLAEEREFALEKSRQKSQFLASMSHEIRTPMTSVLGFAELIINPKTKPDNIVAYVDTIIRNGKTILAIIDDLLDLSKLEVGYLRFNVAEVELKSLIDDALSEVKVIAKERNVTLNIVYFDLPDSLLTDQVRFRQIISNIVGYAIKMAVPGELTVSFRAKIKESGSVGVELFLEDKEKLISTEFFKILFNPLNTFEPEKQKNKSNICLAIILARALVTSLEGTVLRKEGNAFAITMFPLTSKDSLLLPSFPSTRDPTITELVVNDSTLSQCKILITEDNKDIQEILSRILQKAGAKTEVANNGVECLEIMEKNEFDMVLMDLQMQVMDGFQTIERIRAKGYTLPIIVVTAYALNDERERCLNAGCTDFVTKPINGEVLLKTLVRNRNQTNLR